MTNENMGLMKTLVEIVKKDVFVKEYQNRVIDQEVVGIMVSQYFEWDGAKVCDAFLNALEDSNFHSLREKIQNLVNEEFSSSVEKSGQ